MAEQDCDGEERRHLFINIDGKFYFISAECLGKPLDCENDERGEQIGRLAKEYQALAEKDGSLGRVEFAIWLKRCEVLLGVLRGSKS